MERKVYRCVHKSPSLVPVLSQLIQSTPLRQASLWSFRLRAGFPSGVSFWDFYGTSRALLPHASWILGLSALIFSKEYKLWSSSLCWISPFRVPHCEARNILPYFLVLITCYNPDMFRSYKTIFRGYTVSKEILHLSRTTTNPQIFTLWGGRSERERERERDFEQYQDTP
jgi:hypothetical protein